MDNAIYGICKRTYDKIGISIRKTQINGNWLNQSIGKNLQNPIIIPSVATHHNSGRGVIRLRNISDSNFEMKFQEWNHLDGIHGTENAAFIAIEPGVYTLNDGTTIEAGTFTLDMAPLPSGVYFDFNKINFQSSFPGTPKLFLATQSSNGNGTITIRSKKVSNTGFKASMQEQYANLWTGHITETVGYMKTSHMQQKTMSISSSHSIF